MRFSVSLSAANESVLPRWGRELARQLEHRGSQAAPSILGPVTALREVRLTAVALLAGRPARSSDDRESLRDDLRRAIDALGPHLAAGTAPAVAPLRSDLGRLPKLLSEANGALAAVGLAEAALDALADPALVGAAWDDVRAAFEDDEFAGTCELRIKQLAELVLLRGGDWRSTAQHVSQVLFDDPVALAQTGAVDIPDSGPAELQSLNGPAGVALDERLRLARVEIAAEPPTGDMVAWVCFRNASLPSGYLNVAGVEFFGHQLWPGGIASGYPLHSAPRDEFNDDWHKLLFYSMPDEPFVLVCVPLGHGRLTGAVERARSAAKDLVRAAQPHSEWALIKGGAIYVNGGDWGWFGDPLDARERPKPGYSPEYEPTSSELATLDPALVEKLLAGEPQAHNAVRDVEWAEAVSRVADAPQRLALSTRLIERALPAPAGEHWTEPVFRYLKAWWAEQQAIGLISDTAEGAVDLLDSVLSSDRVDKGWRERLLPSAGGLRYTIRLDEALNSVGELIEELPKGSLQSRVAAELAHHASTGGDWLQLLREHDRAFDILLARLVRQRNVILHGADTVPEVVASVAAFALSLQGFVTHGQLRAATADESLLTALERNRIRLERARMRLQAGMSPATAIFEKHAPSDGQ